MLMFKELILSNNMSGITGTVMIWTKYLISIVNNQRKLYGITRESAKENFIF